MTKNSRVQFVIEDELDECFERLAAKMGKSKSSYMRELILNELVSKGLLTEQMMVQLLA